MVSVKGVEEEGGIGAGVCRGTDTMRGCCVTLCPTETPMSMGTGRGMGTHLLEGRTVNRSA